MSEAPAASATTAAAPHGQPAPPLNPAVTHRPTPTPTPFRLCGRVVTGFQRGSKQLGFPTGNTASPHTGTGCGAAAVASCCLLTFLLACTVLHRTANLDPAAFLSVLPSLPRGVYAGWAQVDDGAVHACVLSLGTNPTFGTTEETLEAYILHSFDSDFYSHRLSLIILAFLRPQYTFSSLEQLIAFIKQDVDTARQTLQQQPYAQYQHDPFFHSERSIRSSV